MLSPSGACVARGRRGRKPVKPRASVLDAAGDSPYTPPIEFEGWGFPAFPRF